MTAEPSAAIAADHGAANAAALQRMQVLLDTLLATRFAELQHAGLRVEWAPVGAGVFMQFVRGGAVAPHIAVDQQLAAASDAVLRGAFAHELGHAVIAWRRGLLEPDLLQRLDDDSIDDRLLRRLLSGLLPERIHRLGARLVQRAMARDFPQEAAFTSLRRWCSRLEYRAGLRLYVREERAANGIAIERDLGRELLAFVQHAEDLGCDPLVFCGEPAASLATAVEARAARRLPDAAGAR